MLRTDFAGVGQQAHKDDHLALHIAYNAVYSVKRYEAVGDGVADDLSAIHAARDAAGANGVVFFPQGSYFISAAITPLAGQTFIGAGIQASKILVADDASHNAFAIEEADVTLANLQIDGQRGEAAVNLSQTVNCGAYITAARCTLANVWIRNVRAIGISVDGGGDDLHVLDCRIDGGHNDPAGTTGGVSKGVYVNGALRPVIRGCTITGWSQAVGLWYGVLDGLVEGNRILDNYGFEDASHTVHRSACEDYGDTATHGRNVWTGNVIDGSTSRCLEIAQGVVGSRYLNNILRNPGIISNQGSCFEVAGQSGVITTDILIQGNICYGQAAHTDDNSVNGLAYRISIINNHFIDYTHASNNAPVFIGGLSGPQDILVAGNQFTNCRGGVRLNNNTDGMVVVNNVSRNTLGNAIQLLSGSGHLVTGNRVETTNNVHCVYIGAGGRHKVTSNYLKSNGGSAILCERGDNLIEANECINSSAGNQGAIHITGANALRNKVYRNNCESTTGRRAIRIESSADYTLVQDNTLINGDITESSAGTHNLTEPNHTATVTKAMMLKALGAQTVGTSEATIAHGLGYAPTVVQITMTSAGQIYKSAASDGTNIYLTADDADRTAEVFVR